MSSKLSLDRVKKGVLLYLIIFRLLAVYRHVRARGLIGSTREVYTQAEQFIIRLLLLLPSSRLKIASELATLRTSLTAKLAPPRPHLRRSLTLPPTGLSPEELEEEMGKLAELGAKEARERGQGGEDWKEGRVSGAVYSGQEDVEKVMVEAFAKFAITNPLHPDVFPAIRKMEAEIVSQCLHMFSNPTGAGATTSGGTESILLACKSYRDWGRKVKGITRPEMIVPSTVHAAFFKASDYFGIKLHVIKVDHQTRKVPIHLVKRAINPNTVALVGSAPNFPDGCIDDIEALSGLALRYKIGLHVDCCLGSFIVPFLRQAGYECPSFDFSVPGVTSISSDPHKYGFAPKGISVLLWRDAEWRSHSFYVLPNWSGGLYASPTLAGSRPGALIAGCWAVMMHHGQSGYLASCKKIMATATHIKSSLSTSPILSKHLKVLGDPLSTVVAFTSREEADKKGAGGKGINMYAVGDRMSKRGWHLNALEDPAALHIACTMLTNGETLIKDLETVVQEEFDTKARIEADGGKDEDEGTMVALYGVGQTRIGKNIVPQIAKIFLETLYLA